MCQKFASWGSEFRTTFQVVATGDPLVVVDEEGVDSAPERSEADRVGVATKRVMGVADGMVTY
jgi:hypothetical protein